MTYTREVPSVEGYYFKKHTDPVHGISEKVVYVGRNTEGWRVMHSGPKQGHVEFGFPLSAFNPIYIQWAGPIPEPHA